VERAIALALAKDRDRRLSSALMFATALREAARHRLDERLRRDADDLLAEFPWGSDLLQLLKTQARRRAMSTLARASKPPRSSKPPRASER
jgi:hypothetical protein